MEFQIIMRQNGPTFDAPGFSPGRLIDRLGVPARSVGRAFRPLFAPYRNRLCIARLSGYFVKLHQAGEPHPLAPGHPRGAWVVPSGRPQWERL